MLFRSELYLEEGYSNTVTVVQVPEGTTDEAILSIMRDKYGVMISGCFDVLAGKVIRIGHMGENANVSDMAQTLDAMDQALREVGCPVNCQMKKRFLELV